MVGAVAVNWPAAQGLLGLHDCWPASFWNVLGPHAVQTVSADSDAGCDWYDPGAHGVTELQEAALMVFWKVKPATQLWQMRLLVVAGATTCDAPGPQLRTNLQLKAPYSS